MGGHEGCGGALLEFRLRVAAQDREPEGGRGLKPSDKPDKPANQSCQGVSVSEAFSDNPDKVYALLLLSGLSGLSDVF